MPPHVARAPGRVEVLGNHTDYNGGDVLAATIDRYVWAAGIPSDEVEIHSLDNDEVARFKPHSVETSLQLSWKRYAKGVYWAFERRRHEVSGITAAIQADLQQGAGLGSSAAFEVALANLVLSVSNIKLNPKAIAMLAFEAERIYCGVACGVMDQFTSQLGKPNSLLAIRCSNLVTGDIPWNPQLRLVIVDSGIKRAAGDVLNERRLECQKALQILLEEGWVVSDLSEIQLDKLDTIEDILGETLARRVMHVVLENERVRSGVKALREGRFEDFGSLMYESHTSSRDLYEVSHPMLDTLVEFAKKKKGVIGSRLTGAGLGGATLSVVKEKDSPAFIQEIRKDYESETNSVPEIIETTIPGGVVVTHPW
jgi:galactokinase